uniref:Pentatricopeptide repeat-containing protein n=1 Tax=Kalanchoe fedtschenkoi TaxID=63787 RepID=A0A7N0UIU4_KALFE
MTKPALKSLSSLFPKTTALKSKASTPSSSTSIAAADAAPPADAAIKNLIGGLLERDAHASASVPATPASEWQRNVSAFMRKDASRSLRGGVALSLGVQEEIKRVLCEDGKEEAAILCRDDGLNGVSGSEVEPEGLYLTVPWSETSNNAVAESRKEMLRERKQKWVYKNTKSHRFRMLARKCSERFGSSGTMKVFGMLGRQAALHEFHELIGYIVEEARESKDEETVVEKIYQVFELLKNMKELGYSLDEAAYGPLLKYLIEMSMVEEFDFFCELIKEGNERCLTCLGYYEMLLWIQLDDEEKIQKHLSGIVNNKDEGLSSIEENYLAALVDRDRKKELISLLEVIDVTKVKLMNLINIFNSLGRLSLESLAEKLIEACKAADYEVDNLSQFICCYVISLPNLASNEVTSKFRDIHQKHDVLPSSSSYEKLVSHLCDTFKVYTALDIVKESFIEGVSLSIETIHSILYACDESFEYHLVDQIYAMICQHDLKPTSETFRRIIDLRVKMKNFEGAYAMLQDLAKTEASVTSGMYNAIMAGFLREKNMVGAMMVLRQMRNDDVKPDSMTYSMLIGMSSSEEDMLKYYNEMKEGQIHITRNVYMAIINSYASRGQFEQAKQVVLEKGIPEKQLYDLKSALVSALAVHGQMNDALEIYDEAKKTRCSLDPKAILSVIEHFESEGGLNRLTELLEELSGSEYWCDGCVKVILYCIKHKDISTAVKLIRELKDEVYDEWATNALCDRIFCQIADCEPGETEIGIDFLRAMKEELGLQPSRKGLDFLLAACASAKDLKRSLLVWDEYKANDYPYNVLNYLGMYKALLACGELKQAKKILRQMQQDDYHIKYLVNAFQQTYCPPSSKKSARKSGS